MYHYQKNIGDYRSATMHLSLLEHGVYNQLLDWYYLDEKPLPLDNRTLFRRLSAKSEIEQQAVLDVLSEMFIQTPEGWEHSRVEREIAQYKAKANQAREAGKLGGRPPKKGIGSENNRDGFEKKPDAKPTANQEPITNIYIPNGMVPSGAESPPLTVVQHPAKQIADCPHEAILALWAEKLSSAIQPADWNDKRKQALRQRWREKQSRQNLDWWARFFDYVAQSDFLMGRTSAHGRPAFQLSLDWLCKAENFLKVHEGRYHPPVEVAA